MIKYTRLIFSVYYLNLIGNDPGCRLALNLNRPFSLDKPCYQGHDLEMRLIYSSWWDAHIPCSLRPDLVSLPDFLKVRTAFGLK